MQSRVAALADKHGLTYHLYSFLQANIKTYLAMRETAHQVGSVGRSLGRFQPHNILALFFPTNTAASLDMSAVVFTPLTLCYFFFFPPGLSFSWGAPNDDSTINARCALEKTEFLMTSEAKLSLPPKSPYYPSNLSYQLRRRASVKTPDHHWGSYLPTLHNTPFLRRPFPVVESTHNLRQRISFSKPLRPPWLCELGLCAFRRELAPES